VPQDQYFCVFGRGGTRQQDEPREDPCGDQVEQSVKTSTNVPLNSQGADAAKKIVGRKRGIVTDALGLLLAVTVTAASLSENAIGIHLLNHVKKTHPKSGSTPDSRTPQSNTEPASESTWKSLTETPMSAASTSSKGAG
jgi:hypothetical protein